MPKRILSYGTLERKIRLLFGLMILLIIVASFFFPWYQMESLVGEQDQVVAAEMARAAYLTLHVNQLSSDVKAQLDSLIKVGPPHARAQARTPYVIPYGLPEEAAESPAPEAGSAETAVRIGPPRDNRERKWMEQLAASPEKNERFTLEEGEDGYHLRYAYALRARAGCLECHLVYRPELKEGNLLGAIVIEFPTEETRAKIRIYRAILMAAALVTAALSMILLYAVVRLVIVQPVRHLKHVADRVTEGDLNIRADLETGDEFEALSRSFNRMLQRLEASREELRRANVSLDRKLDELARANVSLFEMNQIKSKFLTTMSHELRTPLNAVIGFAELMEGNAVVQGDPKLSRYVRNIRQSGMLLLDIINDLLDLAKIEAGKMEVKLDQASPLDLCETAMNMVRPMVGPKDLRLELEVADDCPIMTTDANKVTQILYNLLSNAVKFTASGFVRLTARPIDADTMLFQIKDSGPGLSTEQQKLIFDRFSQVDQGHTRQYGGTGLGLSIVRELVSVLGGDVAVQSELSQGATFNVTLPVFCVPEEPAVGPSPVQKVESQPPPKEPAGETAPEPVAPEDTVLAADVEADALKPDEADAGETDGEVEDDLKQPTADESLPHAPPRKPPAAQES